METDRIAPVNSTPRTSIEVEVGDNQSHLAVPPGFLEGVARRTLGGQGIDRASVSIALVDDPTIREINRRHLGHDWPTDVITFPLSDPGDPELSGELVVSAEMAVATAGESGADPLHELALYVVHGLLHLCGLDDQTPEDADAMRAGEGEALASLGLTNTFPLVGPPDSAVEGMEMKRWPR